MLQKFLPLLMKLRERSPSTFDLLVRFAKRFMGGTFGVYPRLLGSEVQAVTEVLRSSQWNMAYGRGLVHERLEAELLAELVGLATRSRLGAAEWRYKCRSARWGRNPATRPSTRLIPARPLRWPS